MNDVDALLQGENAPIHTRLHNPDTEAAADAVQALMKGGSPVLHALLLAVATEDATSAFRALEILNALIVRGAVGAAFVKEGFNLGLIPCLVRMRHANPGTRELIDKILVQLGRLELTSADIQDLEKFSDQDLHPLVAEALDKSRRSSMKPASAVLRITSYNSGLSSPINEDLTDFTYSLLADGAAIVCLQEFPGFLQRNLGSRYLFTSRDGNQRHAAIAVPMDSPWRPVRFYASGDKSGSNLIRELLGLESDESLFTRIARYAMNTVQRTIDLPRRVVIVEVEHQSRSMRIVSYHAANTGLTDDAALKINVALLRGALEVSHQDRVPILISADFNSEVRAIEAGLLDLNQDRGDFYVPTLAHPNMHGHRTLTHPSRSGIDGFFVAAVSGVVVVPRTPYESGATIVQPDAASPVQLRPDRFSYTVKNLAKKVEHTHLAYQLELVVASYEEVFRALTPANPPGPAADRDTEEDLVEAFGTVKLSG